MSDNKATEGPSTDEGLYDPAAVANFFVRRAEVKKRRHLNILLLMKMVFFAHGFATLLDPARNLVRDGFQAWQYGPVSPRAYKIVRSHIKGILVETPIEDPIVKAEENRMREDPVVGKLLEGVYERYHLMDAFRLSSETHGIDSPWSRARERHPNDYYAEIENKDIAEYFGKNHLLSEVYQGSPEDVRARS